MAQTIKLKRSAVAAKEPGTGDLALGELAINTYDGKMYFKKNVSGAETIIELANVGHVHAASDITSGTISTARLGSGTANSTTFLRGDNTWATPSGSGSVATDTIWDAKGDLAVGTGADTAAKLSVGTNNHVLMADSAQTTGVKWAEVATLNTTQAITGSKTFSASYTNITGTLAAKDIQLSGSTVGKTLFFSTDSTATNGGIIVFGTDNGANAQATPKGSIQNLGPPVNDNDAARKKYVDDQVATKANVSHTHNASDINAGTLSVIRGGTGQSSFVNGELLIGNTTGNTLAKATLTGTPNRLLVTNGAGSITLNVDATDANTVNKVVARNASGNFSAGTITAALSGNATTATTLQTARTLTIGSSGKTFNGDANVTWSLAEIGAAADSAVVKLTGDQTIAGVKTFSSDGYFNSIRIGAGPGGSNNLVIGNNAGASLTAGTAPAGNENIAIGNFALDANTTGYYNTAVGYNALSSITTNYRCTAVGWNALANTTGDRNTGVGANALGANTTGTFNVGVGNNALALNTTGGNNMAVGNAALNSNTTGSNNTAIGTGALFAITTTSGNVGIGNSAGRYLSDGTTTATQMTNSIYIGNTTKANATNETNAIVIGANQTSEGANTTVIGNTETTKTTLFGRIHPKPTGTNNVVIGNENTARALSSSNSNIFAIGADAMQSPTANSLGSNNMALGTGAMYWHGATTSPGTENVAIGNSALQFASTGQRNLALGALALTAVTTGSSNVGVGFYSLLALTTGGDNVGIGSMAGTNLTTGGGNVCIGAISLGASNGNSNVAIGTHAGWKQNNGTTDATGLNNCVFVGNATRSNGNNQTNQIVIGGNALGDGSNTTVIGNAETTSTKLFGKTTSQTNTATTNAVVHGLRTEHQSTGTPAVGIGTGIEFAAETAANNTEVGATIEAVTTDVTAASEDFDLVFKLMAGGAAVAEEFRITSTGNITMQGNTLRIVGSRTPASATATGTAGEICWDASYIYVCTATNTWKRVAISTW